MKMNKAIITTLSFLLYAHGIQADKTAPNVSMPDHVKADLALMHSLEVYSQAQASQALLGSFLTVGGDPDQNWCNFSTIQAAINDAAQKGITEIRVAYNRGYHENLTIDDISISLVGGYASCQAARVPFTSPNDNQATINGGANGSVVRISGASQRNTVLLKNLRLYGGSGTLTDFDGNGDYLSFGGGIYAGQATALVSLKNVDVVANSADHGGGINIIQGDTDMLLLDSRVTGNTATYSGGGISCASGAPGSDSSIVVAQNSGIIANIAGASGGGAWLSSCFLALYSGSATSGLVGISANRAGRQGGGIYATESTVALNGQQYCPASGECLGDNTNPASIRANIAGFDGVSSDYFRSGGGIAANRSAVSINAGFIEGNTGVWGGGIMLFISNLTVKRTGKACWNNQRCNYFLGNWSDDFGGAIWVKHGDMDISASFFEQNTSSIGSAIYITDDDNSPGFSTRIEGSVFNNNGNNSTESIIRVESENGLEIVHNTIADNTVSSEIYGAAIIQAISTFGDAPSLGIYSSILDNPGFENLYHNMLNYGASISCIITNDVVSLSAENEVNNPVVQLAGGARILNTIAGFADRGNRNYKLVAGAAAIDYCHTPTYAEVHFKDIEFQQRGVDDPNRGDNYFLSFYDIGADEAYVGPLIFKDGFE
jgi:predicted outer membrane repeat protein